MLIFLFQSFKIGLTMAFIEMRTHKLRSLLSIFGVTLGVASLVVMLTLIGGINVYLNDKLGQWVGSIWIWKSWKAPQNDKISWSRSPGMQFSDGSYLKENSADVKQVFRSIKRWENISVLGISQQAEIQGLDEWTFNEQDTADLRILLGRRLLPLEYATGARTCIVSWEVADAIKRKLKSLGRDSGQIIGTQLNFRNLRLTIVGTLEAKDSDYLPMHLSRLIIMPLLTMQKYVVGFNPDPGYIQLKISDPKQLKRFAERVAWVLIGKHRGARDFEYQSAAEFDEMIRVLNNASLLMAIISMVSLSVGGLGIMNVMLSSVSERIHEIGVRKALGAKNVQIFVQFIVETVTLSSVGGVAGTCVGTIPLLFGTAIQKSTDGVICPTIFPQHLLGVAVLVVLVGVIFGLYPAVKACLMNPVESLRYE